MESSEPLTETVIQIRESSSCVLPTSEVDAISPESSNNPTNVQIVESIMDSDLFDEYFPDRHEAYTYTTFLQAIGKFPSICVNEALCRKTLANMFAHFRQETADLYYIEEIVPSDYCATWGWSAEAYPCQDGTFSCLFFRIFQF